MPKNSWTPAVALSVLLLLPACTAAEGSEAQTASEDAVTDRPLPFGSVFRNNYEHPEHGFRELLRWSREHRAARVDPVRFPIANDAKERLAGVADTERTATWIGHSTFLLQLNGLTILTDPHFTERASPVSFAGPERTTQPGIAMDDLPDIDVIVISHNHYDHLDKGSIRSLLARQSENQPLILVPSRLGRTLERWGASRVTELDWWTRTTHDGIEFTAVPVQHFSARTPFDRNKTLWAGWIIREADGRQILFVGDSGYSQDFSDIHERFGPMDLSLIPIGAYDPRWFMSPMHVDPEEAVQIHLDVESKLSIGMHWGTFILTDEPMREPLERLAKAREAAEIAEGDFLVLQHGETILLDP